MRIRKTLGENLQGFTRLWERILQDFGRGFTSIRETLGEDFKASIRETLGEDLQGKFMSGSHSQGQDLRLWERICKDSRALGEDLQDFGRGFARIRETLGEDL